MAGHIKLVKRGAVWTCTIGGRFIVICKFKKLLSVDEIYTNFNLDWQ